MEASEVVPAGADGRPLVKVKATAEELVGSGAGMPDFSNCKIGPIEISAWVEDDPVAKVAKAFELQQQAQYVIASCRRPVQWKLNPATKPSSPDEINELERKAVAIMDATDAILAGKKLVVAE